MPRVEYHPCQGAYPSDRPSSADPYLEHLRAIVRAQVEHRDGAGRPVDHRADPVPRNPDVPDGAIECRVCGRPVRTADGGRFPIHAAV